MEQGIVTIPLTEYEDLKQYKDNFHKKNFISVLTNEGYISEFYSDEDMSMALMKELTIQKNRLITVLNEKEDYKCDIANLLEKNDSLKLEIERLEKQIKKPNIFSFLR
jgi:hypothetical protein